MSKKNILIIGGRSPAALEFSRLLSKDHNIFSADPFKYTLCRFSNSVIKSFKISSPRNDFNNFKNDIFKIVKDEKIDIVFSMNEDVFYLAKIKNELSEYTKVFCENIDVLKKYHSKLNIYNYIDNTLINKPATYIIKDQKHLDEINTTHNDFVAKLEYSRFSNGVCFSPDILDFQDNNNWLFQEKINGKEYCTYAIAENGTLKAQTCYRPIFRIKGSASVCFQNIRHEKIYNFVDKFIKDNKYTGQIGFDIIENKNGDLFLIECNPRATSGIHLIDENFSLDNNEQYYYNTIDKKLSIPMLFLAIKDEYFSGSKLKSFFKSKEAVFSLKDPFPVLFQFVFLFEAFLLSRKYKITLIESLTYDIEWNGD